MKHIVLPSYSIRAGADLHGKVSIFGAVEAKADFTAVWDTTKTSTGSSAINQVRLPLISTGVYNFVVDWGDGNQDTITTWNQAEVLHTYVTQGIYTVRITGQIEGFRFNNTGDRLKLHNVSKWGPLKLISDAWFHGCANFTSNAADWPLVDTSSFYRAFMDCTLFNGDVSNWNTSGVSNMAECFYGASSFNQDIGGWDVSAVTNMSEMFRGASAFNNGGSGNIGNWVIKNDAPVNMAGMFRQATVFNQDIGGWDVSAVTDMGSMFRQATVFKQDIGGWDVSAVTDMSQMFRGASAFNQDIGGWDVSAVTDMGSMFLFGGLSNANYNNILVGWTGWTNGAATKTLQDNVAFHAGTAKYSTGDPADARAWLVDTILNGGKAWTITDGGPI
jgi:surface protein